MDDDNGWISVKDKLPTEDGDYIVWGNTTGRKENFVDMALWSNKYESFAKAYQPTHWMPLPSPPKTSGNDD